MKLGFLTGALGDIPLKEKIEWAHQSKFDCIEISCWPKMNSRDYSASDIDVDHFTQEDADELNEFLKEKNMFISSLAYYDNHLHEDLNLRKSYHDHLKKVINAASMLGVELVGTFVGRHQGLSIVENFQEFKVVFSDILDFAQEKNVKIIIENCPMPVWHEDGLAGTISYSPELWDEMFKIFPHKHFGLNFDPSHLVWLQIDYIKALKDYKERILHIHAKDTKMIRENLNRYGIYGKQLHKMDPFDLGWVEAKLPGNGDVDWNNFFKTLKEMDYKGVVSIEHEDPSYEGNSELVKEGLLIGKENLERAISRQ
ncbi:Xylose isomerase domain protein TIM barrel [Alkaliphilus metalliredigens QYMF]|uniref:Xylose isomerase domain protein TIM barrel n=1 Tax=Alkaliphilus metalliredigens (strain QYMF) TaxID=293826 RepID=A6TKG9_ALKMQ|nr:sugar phosphate isomerase/epimerase [Alkaliphilus metalliredigens]ABR46687.1 Xylose isomerase domain protein TIM barrel [Alkaliphilus metalliredigens QYMF]